MKPARARKDEDKHSLCKKILKENENINAIFGIAYENECSKINLTFNRRFSATATLPEDTKIEIKSDDKSEDETNETKTEMIGALPEFANM